MATFAELKNLFRIQDMETEVIDEEVIANTAAKDDGLVHHIEEVEIADAVDTVPVQVEVEVTTTTAVEIFETANGNGSTLEENAT
jgi:hypothetical protein